jgi:hypothetical protein
MRRSTVLACLLPFLLSLLAIGQPSAFKSTGPVASSTVHKIDPKLRTMAQAGGHLPVFIVLRSQPYKAILERESRVRPGSGWRCWSIPHRLRSWYTRMASEKGILNSTRVRRPLLDGWLNLRTPGRS